MSADRRSGMGIGAETAVKSGLGPAPFRSTNGWSITTPVELFDHLAGLGPINWTAAGICIPDAERGQG